MKCKHDEMWQDWDIIDARLKQVLRMIDAFSILCFDKEIMITSLYRGNDKKSQHSKGKAADIRTKWYARDDIYALQTILFFTRDYFNDLAVEPHEELKGKKHQHLHIHIK